MGNFSGAGDHTKRGLAIRQVLFPTKHSSSLFRQNFPELLSFLALQQRLELLAIKLLTFH